MCPYCRDESQQSIARAMRIAAAAAAMLAANGAHGQAGASVSLTSEYSARGQSLSDGRASPQLSLSWDGVHGWYAGAFAAPRLTLAGRTGIAKMVAYGGYAHRLRSGLSWEAGASRTVFSNLREYNYNETWLGLASDRLSARLYYTPAYYGYFGRVAYAELNGFHPIGERINLIAHVGVLHGLRGLTAAMRDRVDVRLAVGVDAGPCNVQLAWLGTTTFGSGRVANGFRSPRALAVTATYSF